MRIDAIESKLAELRVDHESVPWADRVRLVHELFGTTGRVRTLPPPASALLRLLASDPKWEVRKEVADHLHRLGDSEFAAFTALLIQDENAFVKSAAERALTRRRKGHISNAKRVRGLDRMEDELRQVEIRHGTKVSDLVRNLAHRLYEGLVGASVHEMRSIVTAMKANVEILERSPESDLDAVVRKVGVRLTRQVAFLELLLNDMRDYTQVPTRERGTERVADLLKEAAGMVHDEFVARGRDVSPIKLQVDVPEDLVVAVSRVQIVLAFRNLLKNAHEAFILDETQFTEGSIEVTATAHDDGVQIQLRDDGMGLSEDELDAVRQFIPGRTSKTYLGTGFGLPIARRNIQTHGGDIRIDSRVDEGTTVTVWLPASGKGTA